MEGVVEAEAGDDTSADFSVDLTSELTPAMEKMQTKRAVVINIPFFTKHFTISKVKEVALSSPQGTRQVQGVPHLERRSEVSSTPWRTFALFIGDRVGGRATEPSVA